MENIGHQKASLTFPVDSSVLRVEVRIKSNGAGRDGELLSQQLHYIDMANRAIGINVTSVQCSSVHSTDSQIAIDGICSGNRKYSAILWGY